jgi:outer membrane biosynthesis protein TonB
MNRTFHIATTVLVSCCVFSFAQTTTPPTEQKQEALASPAAPSSQPPTAGSAKAVFGSGSTSQGSAIEQITRAAQAAEAKRGHFASGPLEVLSDTKGVDFGSYVQLVEAHIRSNWHNLIPEQARAPLMKKGKVTINFAILKDGTVAGMRFVSTSGDVTLDPCCMGQHHDFQSVSTVAYRVRR